MCVGRWGGVEGVVGVVRGHRWHWVVVVGRWGSLGGPWGVLGGSLGGPWGVIALASPCWYTEAMVVAVDYHSLMLAPL